LRDSQLPLACILGCSETRVVSKMFVLAIVEDKLKILPEQFDRDSRDVLIEQIDSKYSNKVLLEVGLCISFYDILEVQDAFVYPAEGSCHQVVKFRLIIYRPFVNEVLKGKLIHSDAEGVRVSMGFFDDIHIPASCLRQPASFNPGKKVWTWHYHGDENEESQELDMIIGEDVCFRVTDCVFTLVTRSMRERRVTSSTSSAAMATDLGGNLLQNKSQSSGGFFGVPRDDGSAAAVLKDEHGVPVARRQRSLSNVSISDDAKQAAVEQPAMQILGDISTDDGLGMLNWW
jgi:DNA-directed RNA polymerase III subunit RPC8